MTKYYWYRELPLFLLALIGYILTLPAVIPQLITRMFKDNYDNGYYLHQLAVALDVSMGANLFGSRHTISAKTGYYAHIGYGRFDLLERVIDSIFGRHHCYLQARQEQLIKKGL